MVSETTHAQHARSLVRQAYSASREGRYQCALELYDQAIELCPTYAWAHAHRAETRVFMRGDINTIIADFEQAIALKPDYAWARMFLARSLELRGSARDFADAVQHLDRAFESDPDWLIQPRYFGERGLVNLLAGDHLQAQRDFERGLSCKPGDPWDGFLRYHRAETEWLFGKLEAAITRIREAEEFIEHKAICSEGLHRPWEALYYLAGLGAMQGRDELALSHLENAIQMQERAAHYIFCGARVRASMGLAWHRFRARARFLNLIAPHTPIDTPCTRLILAGSVTPSLPARVSCK